mgnify:CR=1 FL=1
MEGFFVACMAIVGMGIFAHTMTTRTIEPGEWEKAEELCLQNSGVKTIRLGNGDPEIRCANGAQFVLKEQPHDSE